MSKRLLTAIVGIPVLAAILIIGDLLLYLSISLVAAIGIYEYCKSINGNENIDLSLPLMMVLVLGTLSSFRYFQDFTMAFIILSAALLVSRDIFRDNVNIYNTVFGVYGLIYVSFFLGHLILLDGLAAGSYLVWLVFIISFSTDTFAYIVGMRIGKHRLSPKISPKKSIEGSIGGTLAAVLITLVYGIFVSNVSDIGLSVIDYGIIAIVASPASQIGDLAASMIKRQFGIKDFGNLLPGHGGVLDRFDSVIFASPVIYYMVIALTL
ncbi:phosphatidate cytidylyltransferase [Alkalibacter mobilis]|uniref:phosphatidate cytidylyltransferase n=1 Tax=Alkalibacter mobilis TaxID=2787712 RepID=UPI00189DF3ED|nr:phosphatidate cytidylyltransferase [Alkalibacter mobilis]MBF7095811.1 phosphatidate cytidylyltransferase [Alkalibacter mobilis]